MRSRVLSWCSIHPHTNICLGKITMIDPQKGSRTDKCMAFKTIWCDKLKAKRLIVKSQNSKTKSLYQRKDVERIKTSRSKGLLRAVLLHLWAWNKFITHTKWHYGWKNPNQSLKVKEAIKEDSEDKCHLKGKTSKEC